MKLFEKKRHCISGFLASISFIPHKETGRWQIFLSSVGVCLFLLWSGSIQAQTEIGDQSLYEFSIPAQPLIKSLNVLSNQTETFVLFPYDLVEGRQSHPVYGQLTVREALDRMLLNTGLEGGLSKTGVLMVSLTEPEAVNNESRGQGSMTRNQNILATLLGAILGTGGVQTAQAQISADAAGTQTRPIEEIIITALKTEGTVQDTPIAVSVVTGEELRRSGINNVTDLPDIAPALEVENTSFGPVIGIRGVTTTDNTSKGDQGIAFNIDGVTVGRPREQQIAFFDINRVEVLRGPQGTLYGKSTTGGVVNFITNRPQDELSAEVNLELSNYNTRRTLMVLNTPVNERTNLRLAVNQNVSAGWLETDLGDPDVARNSAKRNDVDDQAFRLSGTYDFSDTSSLFITGTAGNIRGTGTGGVPYGIFEGESGEDRLHAFGNPFEPRRNEDFSNLTLEYATQVAGMDLTYTGGVRNFDINTIYSTTYDPSFSGSYEWIQYQGTADTQSHELRLAGSNQRMNWVAGINWYREDLWESDHRWSAPVTNPTLAGSLNGIDPLNNTDHESQGIFGQLNWLLTDRLNLTLGLRYSEDEVVRVGTFAATPANPVTGDPWLDPEGNICVAPAHCVGSPNNHSAAADKITYRVGLDYEMGQDGMFYGSVATGYKAGGFNDFGPGGPAAGTDAYEPESMTAYELGFKGYLGSNLQYTSALYYYDYEEAQIQSFTFLFGPPVLYTYIAPVKMQGWENELTWTPTEADRIDFELRFADSEYVDFDVAGTGSPGSPGVSWDGLPIDRIPDLAGSLSYAHDWFLTDGASINARIRTRYSSGYVLSVVANDYRLEQDAFTRTDLNLTYYSADQRLSVGVFVRNLENELQLTSPPGPHAPGEENGEDVGVSEPITFGLSFGYQFF